MRREDAPPSNSTSADTLMLFFSRSGLSFMPHSVHQLWYFRPGSLFCVKYTQATFRQKSSIIRAPVAHPEGSARLNMRGALQGR